tara:strand:+ start:1376 stop:2050 length:675 start_codon:yes stop_codon:yes gene_type:complete
MFDNAEYYNDVSDYEVQADETYQSMVDQWTQNDKQLDQLFANEDFKIQEAMMEMYKNDYAGTQTGRSAARMSAQSIKEAGFKVAQSLSNKMLSAEEVELRNNAARSDAMSKTNSLYQKVRFSPVHGATPPAPELEAMPSKAGLILGLAGAAVGGWKAHKEFSANKYLKGGSNIPKNVTPTPPTPSPTIDISPGKSVTTFQPTPVPGEVYVPKQDISSPFTETYG